MAKCGARLRVGGIKRVTQRAPARVVGDHQAQRRIHELSGTNQRARGLFSISTTQLTNEQWNPYDELRALHLSANAG